MTRVREFMTDPPGRRGQRRQGHHRRFNQPFRDAGASFHGDAGSCVNTAEFLLMAPVYAVA
jgi:hypothetical protein